MGTTTAKRPWVPPRWFKRAAWRIHRWIYRVSDGRRGLKRPSAGKSGLLRLRAIGRRSGEERAVILAYFEDGDRYVTLAMNGWDDPAPQWWLNLCAQPDVVVDTVDGPRLVHGRAAEGDERQRLWAALGAHEGWGAGIDRFAALRSRETPVVVLEPRAE
ncbi:hypothetical protein Xcel_0176 [Xylanimonas cellulosilytica DSM 15894]|uniref:Nitroreductase family deazaflavin-dependent oxidoreductase n=1 Tax=Xylanimonas cellulosilytica (strain DSM 15894 / JCM 12276 / CECT 5975 / KCTC 9989 / LMG 20990 / NBRC 107835 / XIL07) TaxID=446471 RepID=D1BU51_XYLCX|nr:nitroreductase/quinone reductase family protein [Xylanimonas cellulosilytica]ACZ29215.1 hypothetical protein Xcel_0176 [Xylanimonas cellulosilytica DSM 15894]